jgi:hypothetical protein
MLFYISLWKVCNWKAEKVKIKNSAAASSNKTSNLLRNRISDIKTKINSDPMISLMNMNRF